MAFDHTLTICQWLRDQTLADMLEDSPTGIGAKIIQLGDISYFSGVSVSSIVPIILVKPLRAEYGEGNAGLLRVEVEYTTRVVYIRSFSESEDVVTNKVTDTIAIVEALWKDWLFDGIVLDAVGSQVISSGVSFVEYDPEEDIFAMALDESLSASAVEVETVISMNRKQT